MKNLAVILAVLLLTAILDARANAAINGKKTLVAYFSWGGNTEVIANMISEKTGGDLIRVLTVNPYPTEYRACTDAAAKEQRENARPALSTKVENMEQYDVVFIGYPNWWGTLPMAMFTFLEGYDLSGKTIIPFSTHEGSGLGRGPSDISTIAPKSVMLQGLAVRGGSVKGAKSEVENWVDKVSAQIK